MIWLLTLLAPGCAPCSGSGPVDPEAWEASAAAVEAEFEESGECPSDPPDRVVMSGGCEYEPDVEVFDSASTSILGSAQVWRGGFSLSMDAVEAEVRDCDSDVFDVMDAARLEAHRGAHVFFDDAPTSLPHLFGPEVSEVDLIVDGEREGLAYSWVCLDSAPGPAGTASLGPPSGAWHGSIFMHRDDLDGAPVDAFFAFDEVDCTYNGENEAAGSDTGGTWDESCDGIDNDFDGQVDEGAQDADGNGVPDCDE